jgi:hypothetical protein
MLSSARSEFSLALSSHLSDSICMIEDILLVAILTLLIPTVIVWMWE